MELKYTTEDEKLHEECGVFGVWDSVRQNVSGDVYYGLTALQHRGQEAAGIAACNSYGPRGNLCIHKGKGLVSEVFTADTLNGLCGNIAIGHVRYSTTGDGNLENAQPLSCYYLKGTLALAHNGNIVNCDELKKQLMQDGMIFHATTDTEVIEVLLAKLRGTTGSIESAVSMLSSFLEGGYALLVMSPRKLIVARDKLGLKPLCLGKTETGWVVASESCALYAVGAEFVRDIAPGEVLTISKKGLESNTELCGGKCAHCIFEYIYFARPDSVVDGVSVYDSRIKGGRILAETYPVDADIVAGVPESGMVAAAGYSLESGIPFLQIFHKNSYIGRTFIKPTQRERESAVHNKLSILKTAVSGKRIVLIDDSIVRGTTIANIIKDLRAAGATEVHVRISSPPFLHPCYYGTDVPDCSGLIASRMSPDEICKIIGADSLGYMRVEDLERMTGSLSLCKACFTGDYPTPVAE